MSQSFIAAILANIGLWIGALPRLQQKKLTDD
jgi:hypothetical protein